VSIHLRRAVEIVGVLTAAGCVLIVDPPEGDAQCRFAGEATACGACVKAQCQDELGRCCGERSCETTLAALDGCAAVHDARCTTLKALGAGEGNALAACIRSRCPGSCEPFAGRSSTSCEVVALSGRAACACKTSSSPNDFTCATAVFSETKCCAPHGWPSPGLDCQCRPAGCERTEDGCTCRLVLYSPTLRVCEGRFCCTSDEGCSCRERGCDPWETRVDKCDVGAILCRSDQTALPACSVRSE